ncbi:uncharacterized protein LOC123511130 [Portunus trituberculatus]|uniref:uncharacterized protein LOC123511130 n=1 Tax=Portunus trituberculatus TaxID=210409 RepID=UPI001E1D14B7|nr:uncharacterized protein LOC123511130 [Portunus trituberculatus]
MAAREEPHRHHLRQRRSFRERKDVLNELDDRELVERYWQDPAGIIFVTNLVRERLKRPTARNKASLPEMQVIFTAILVTQLENQWKKEEFLQIAGFPEVIGGIDGTHVMIVAPREYKVEFVNRKRYYSINV